MQPIPGVAGGNISPSRFVRLSTAADNTYLQAGAGEKIVGVSQKGTRRAPYGSLDDGYAAIAGENILVFAQGMTCGLELGGTVAAGDRLKADADGKGVAAGTGEEYGAIAPQAGTSGDVIEVQVDLGKLP